MEISYKRLWKMLIDKDLKKQDLCALAHISSSTVAKLTKGENVSTAVLLKICKALECNISDIMEAVKSDYYESKGCEVKALSEYLA